MIPRVRSLLRWGGVDRAVFFSVATQLVRFVTGPITLVLVLRHLTPEAQGYYYTFGSVVALQVFLEMGFSQSILQFAAHEFAQLKFTARGTVAGDPVALSRLLSLGRLAFAYYATASILLMAGLGLGGYWFFRTSGTHGVAWESAWWVVAIASSASLAIHPAWALLEGCDQISRVAQARLWLALAGCLVNAVALISGAGLFTQAVMAVFSLFFSLAWLFAQWRPFLLQFAQAPQHGTISWRREIWPFQWRIAISWISGYFIFDIVNPIAFRICGPGEAGRLGVSFQLVRMIAGVATMWLSTKVPRFGVLVANRAWPELDTLWRRSTAQALAVAALGLGGLLAGLPLLSALLPEFSARFAPLRVFVWLGAAVFVQVTITAMAFELRAHRREPFVGVSVLGAILSALLMIPLTRLGGIVGLSIGYTLATVIAAIPAIWIFAVKRREYRGLRAPHLQPA